MTYRQLQAALKTYKAQGLTQIKLNSNKVKLQAEYNRLVSTSDKPQPKPEFNQEENDEFVCKALKNLAIKRGYSHQEAATLAEKALKMTRAGEYPKAYRLFISRLAA
jgi:protein involved in temperature-dependent protein secretion